MSKLILLFIMLLIGWPAVIFPQEVAIENTRGVASAALPTFRQLITQQKNYREMGFDSPDQLDKASVGDPFQQFFVRLDELAKYNQDQDPRALLHDRKRVLYPVVVDHQVRSSITVASTAKGWTATAFGAPKRIRMLSKRRADNMETTKQMPSAYFVVEIPGLKLVFLGYRTGEVLMLIPLLDDPTFNFREGLAVPANKVFTALKPAVRSHMDLPG